MKAVLAVLLCVFLLGIPASAADAAGEYGVDTRALEQSLSDEARDSLGSLTPENGDVEGGLRSLWTRAVDAFREHLHETSGVAFAMVAICALIGLVTAFARSAGLSLPIHMAEIASVCTLAVMCFTSIGSLLEACRKAIEGMSLFSKALIPAFAAATAVAGKPVSAVSSSAAAILFSGVLIELALHVFLPGVYLYIGVTAAGIIARQDVLTRVAELIKWACVSFYKVFVMIFMGYMTLSGVVSGGADAAAVKTARVAIAGAVPVLGSVVADASDAILTGAGVLRSALGIYGFLGACALCLIPFVSALTRYLVFKALSVASASLAQGGTAQMVDGIAEGYGIALGLLGTCCAVQFISLVVSTVVIRI